MAVKNMSAVAASLKAQLEKDIRDISFNEVADAVKEVHAQAIEDTVYQQYSPKFYKRRREADGLKDKRNMRVNPRGKLGFRMTNVTRGNSRYGADQRMRIAESIERGTGVMKQIGGRKFFATTIARLRRNKDHVKAFENGFKARGYKVWKRAPR